MYYHFTFKVTDVSDGNHDSKSNDDDDDDDDSDGTHSDNGNHCCTNA